MAIGGVGGAVGGQSLGNARGSITIDTSSLSAATSTARTFGNQIEQSIGRAGTSATSFGVGIQRVGQQTEQSMGRAGTSVTSFGAGIRQVGRQIEQAIGRAGARLTSFSTGIRQLRGELIALGVAAGAITFRGLLAVDDLRKYRILFTALLGDQKEAEQLMTSIAEQAQKFGLNLTESLQLSRALIPVLEDGAQSLDAWIARAARLVTVNPLKSTTDAIRAINEFLAGQPRTLQFVFNIPPEVIRQAQAASDDIGEQFEFILNKMGATEDAALELGEGFRGTMEKVRNELTLALSVGFAPFLNQGVIPFLTRFRELLQHLRETSPALLKFGSSLVGMIAIGTPVLVFLGAIISSLEKIKRLSFAATLGRAGVGAAALAVGAGIGVEGVQAVGRATENERLAGFGIGDAAQTLRQWLLVVVDGLTKFAAILGGIVTQVQQRFVNAIFTMIQAIGNFVQFVGSILQRAGDIIPDFLGGDKLAEFGDSLVEAGEGVNDWVNTTRDTVNMSFQATRDGILQWQQDITAAAARFLGFMPSRAEEAPAGRAAPGAEPVDQYTDEQRDAIADWYSELRRIEADANQQRIEATIQYEDQRTQVIADYELQIAREAEDFARQRARDEARLQSDIADIRADALEREAEWWADLQDRIADIRADSAERIEQIENDINRRREQLQREHRLTLLEAASRLDARAVATEQRRFQEQNRQLDQELDERTAAEQDNLEERIEQEEEAHQERLEQAREADEERIRDMEEAQRERQRMEDEDRRIRLQRQEEDHRSQLTQMDRFHAERIYRITSQETRERIQQNYAFRNRMIALDFHNQAWLTAQENFQNASLIMFEGYFADVLAMQPSSISEDARPGGIGHQFGGFSRRTGLAMLHGTQARPETILSQSTTAALRSMIGNFSQPDLIAAVSGAGMSSRTLTIQSGAITVPIYPTPGMSPQDISREVERVLDRVLEDLSI